VSRELRNSVKPKTSDFIGAAALAIVLLGLVAIIFIATIPTAQPG
jgi:hypothetical protein